MKSCSSHCCLKRAQVSLGRTCGCRNLSNIHDLPSAEAAVRSAFMGDIALLREQRRANEDRILKLEMQVGTGKRVFNAGCPYQKEHHDPDNASVRLLGDGCCGHMQPAELLHVR